MDYITSELLHQVIARLPGPDFDKCMVTCGPKKWKEASLSVAEAKKLVLMILCREKLAVPFAVYLSLYNRDVEPAQHLYDLQLGREFVQGALEKGEDAKTFYMFNIAQENPPLLAIMPSLKDDKHYACLNRNFVKDISTLKLKERLDVSHWSVQQVYYGKLTSAMACSRAQRWAECFAFALSALDSASFQSDLDHLPHVFYYLVLSAGHLSISAGWCCDVLTQARLFATSPEHSWQRLIAFQAVILQHGYFSLEQDVFEQSLPLFVKRTAFYQQFLTQHLHGLLAQIEYALAYQYVRQRFHEQCDDFCQVEPNMQYNFEECKRLIGNIDVLAGCIKADGVKEYFRAYCHLYSTMTNVHQHSPSVIALNRLSLAILSFELAKSLMKSKNSCFADCCLMSTFLRRKYLPLDRIEKYFAEREMCKHTIGARYFLFRAMILTMYWENRFQPFPVSWLASHAHDMDYKVTHGHSYRQPLLMACVRIQDASLRHKKRANPMEDFPLQTPSSKDTDAKTFWLKESSLPSFTHISEFQSSTTAHSWPLADSLLVKNKLAEQAHAFGYHIVESYTTSTDE